MITIFWGDFLRKVSIKQTHFYPGTFTCSQLKIYITYTWLLIGAWGQAKKVWFDPKNFYNKPIDLNNVIDVEIDIQKIPETFAMEQIGKKLPNVEGLIIVGTCWGSNLQGISYYCTT